MKREDKIKDFIEPQAFDEVQNYGSDPARVLAAYRFTDATSDLLARLLDALADLPRSRGAARALAGLRGVGKSHTLAAFGALAAFPDLRSTVADAHVATSARRLLNRRYMVARVERGTRPTLLEEIGAAFAALFGGTEADWTGEPASLLAIAASRLSDTPLVVVIDTAYGREARVKRDDGPLLSELASATEHVNAFIALALDDDIQGADGANVALAGTYQIDYLDPEHIYRIADLHLFQKSAQARVALHEIYTTLREAVPGFNWSEPRFAAIYPVHPLVADVSAAVRLYAPTFAFLPFAAAASARAVNRPASSLIVLDEVFDRAEYDLRKSEELRETFAAYDRLANETISQFPIMQRHQAKLILKGLFILSLDGRGATARELGAAMLIYDEVRPETAIERIEEMLARFAEAAPESSLRHSDDADEVRYRLSISASAGFEAALAAAADEVESDDAAVKELLRGVAQGRFEDWPFAETVGDNGRTPLATDFIIMWRGMGRRGRLIWQAPDPVDARADDSSLSPGDSAQYDWQITLLECETTGEATAADEGSAEHPAGPENAYAPHSALWRPARMTAEEMKNLRRLVALRTNNSLTAEFAETARAAERTQTALAERIWTRIYLDDGLLVMNDAARPFTPEARSASTLTEALARMLAPLLGASYPQHPVFTETLDEGQVARLVSALFGGANQSDDEVQELARLFALPLGLVSLRGELYALEAGDQALRQPWVREVLALTDAADGEAVPLAVLYEKLRGEPYGLLREAQYLILAALVAQRRIELITSSGDRIGRRTLDLKLKWDEIAGVARASALLHSAEELTDWARLLTGDAQLSSIADPQARERVRAALAHWLEEWRAERLLERFDALPDDCLTTRGWNVAAVVRKSFGAAADSVEAALDDTISLEEGLQRVADAFGDAPEQFKRSTEQRAALTSFTAGFAGREQARAYLALAEPTNLEEIESARRELLAIAGDVHSLFDQESTKRFDLLWREFQARYSEHYAAAHDETVGAAADARAVDALTRSREWREFEMLSRLSIVNHQYWEEVEQLLERLRNMRCDLPVRQLLFKRPVCHCSFRLTRAASLAASAQALEEAVRRGLDAHRRALSLWGKPLAHALDALAQQESDPKIADRVRTLSASLAQTGAHASLSLAEARLIEQALQKTGVPPLRVSLPSDGYGLLTRDELRARLQQWLDDLPDYPALVEVTNENGNDGG
jgi:hypothetical protein